MIVENVLRDMNESVISIEALKRKLSGRVSHIKLMNVLQNLEEHNKIVITLRGISWIENNNPRLKKEIMQAMNCR